MAELSNSRNRKAAPKVDLTAMVDLAFLLITFFMLTTSLSKPIAMDIAKPDKPENPLDSMPVPASRTMTILLGKDNQVAWYMGEVEKANPKIENMKNIRQSILRNKSKLEEMYAGDSKKSLIVIVKPTASSKFEDFVDIMDEVSLSKLTLAPAIDDEHILEAEREFMAKNKI